MILCTIENTSENENSYDDIFRFYYYNHYICIIFKKVPYEKSNLLSFVSAFSFSSFSVCKAYGPE